MASTIVKIALQRTWQGTIRGLDNPNQLDVFVDRNPIAQFTVGGECANSSAARCQENAGQREFSEYEQTADAGLEIKIDAKAGTRLIAVAFRKDSPAQEGKFEPAPAVTSFDYAGMKETNAAIDRVEIRGPYQSQGVSDTASRGRIFVCKPKQTTDEDVCARKILSGLARRAYRRPVTEPEVQTLLRFYKDGRSTEDFEAGIEAALRRVLVSVNFLFRVEQDPSGVAPGTPYRLNDLELASRLSFFLWSSIPDDELLTLAERNQLGRADVLAKQVQRMLADERANALVKNFAGQWLFLRKCEVWFRTRRHFPISTTTSEKLYRERRSSGRDILRREPASLSSYRRLYVRQRTTREALWDPGGIWKPLPSRIAERHPTPRIVGTRQHPDGDVVRDADFARAPRQMAAGEHPGRAPPPPPPPNVPALSENDETMTPRSVRERMEQHRQNPTCASCHARMDPWGSLSRILTRSGGGARAMLATNRPSGCVAGWHKVRRS